MDGQKSNSVFKRSTLVFRKFPSSSKLKPTSKEGKGAALPKPSARLDSEASVLVINAGQEMAKEMTAELSLSFPGCGIIYAPTLEVARWVLNKRRIDLIVSSHILPDGPVSKLQAVLSKIENPPDVVVVGDLTLKSHEIFGNSGYELLKFRRITRNEVQSSPAPETLCPIPTRPNKFEKVITELGNDIRNDLNNPLQAIVAMVFVAQSGKGPSQMTEQALDAIEKTAKGMSAIVNQLENKIKEAVSPIAKVK